MTTLSRTKEFFAQGGVLFSNKSGFLAKTVAGLGLATVITVFPNDVGNSAIPSPDKEVLKPATQFGPGLAERIRERKRMDAEAKLKAPPLQSTEQIIASLPSITLLPSPVIEQTASGNPFSDALGDAIDLLQYQVEQFSINMTTHQFGEYEVSQFVAKELVRAANDADFPVDTLFAITEKESSFDVTAKNPKSSAAGPMQFLEQKWLEMVKDKGAKYGLEMEANLIEERPRGKVTEYYVKNKTAEDRILDLRFSPYYAGVMGAENLLDAKKRIEDRVQTSISNDDLYLPHFLGTAGAGSLIEKAGQKPNALASKAFPAAAKANKNMFRGKGGRPLTLGQFHEKARNVIRQRLGKYENVEAIVAATAKPHRHIEPDNSLVEIGYTLASAITP